MKKCRLRELRAISTLGCKLKKPCTSCGWYEDIEVIEEKRKQVMEGLKRKFNI